MGREVLDINDLHKRHQITLDRLEQGTPIRIDKHISTNKESVVDAMRIAWEREQRGVGLAGMSTGFWRLDRILDGMRKGSLYCCGGRPGMGKSMLALSIALNVAKYGHGVLYVSLEMTTAEHGLRQLFALSGIPSHRWKRHQMRKEDWAEMTLAANAAAKLPIIWDDATGQTIEAIHGRIKLIKGMMATTGASLELVIIDHALLIEGTTKNQDRRSQMVHITRRMKAIAKEEDIAILALAQLNRGVEARTVKDKRPQMTDFKETGSWEEDGDAMLLLYREDYYKRDVPEYKADHILEINVPKVREGDPGMVKLHFDGSCQRILQLSNDPEPPEES